MKYLENPKDREIEDAMVQFTVEEENIYRLRFGFTTATTGPANTHQMAAAAFTPYNLLYPLVPNNVQSTTMALHRDKSLMLPTGPAPSDTTGVDMLLPSNSPTNVSAYEHLYERYHVSAVDYTFKLFNYEDFDCVVGITVLPLSCIISKDASGSLVKVNTEDFGNDVYFDPRQSDNRFVNMITKQNTIMGRLPAGTPTGTMARTGDVGAEPGADQLHIKPGTATITQHVGMTRLYEAMSREGGFEGVYDVEEVSGDYGSTISYPDGANGFTEAPVVVWLWVCNEQAYFEYMGGTAADTDDHYNGLSHEGWGTACNNWTAKIAVHPKVDITTRLFDPIADTIPVTTAPDVTQAS
jgi:hypothetical protein